VQAEDNTPNYADPMVVMVNGRFIDQQQTTGTLGAVTRGDCGYRPLTFTATRARSLPANPVKGRRYPGLTVHGTHVWFHVSRSGRRVTAFRIARTRLDSFCTYKVIMLARSDPAAGLRPDRNGVFGGVLSSHVAPGGRQAGDRVHVSVLFLSRTEATGTFHLLDRSVRHPCRYETVPFRAKLAK
jgi:hypothetical protein